MSDLSNLIYGYWLRNWLLQITINIICQIGMKRNRLFKNIKYIQYVI